MAERIQQPFIFVSIRASTTIRNFIILDLITGNRVVLPDQAGDRQRAAGLNGKRRGNRGHEADSRDEAVPNESQHHACKKRLTADSPAIRLFSSGGFHPAEYYNTADVPPSMLTAVPVTYDAASDTRKAMTFAASSA